MSQRKEKYARSLSRRMDETQGTVRGLEMETYRHGVRIAVAEGELQEIREERRQDTISSGGEESDGQTNAFLRAVLAAAVVVYLILIACIMVRALISLPPEEKAVGGVVYVSTHSEVDKQGPQWSGD